MQLFGPDLHTLAGAYALDAMEPGAELDRFTRHLRRCQTCAAEAVGLREVATTLGLAVAAEPPPAMRGRVLAAVRQTRQLAPEPVPGERAARRFQLRIATAIGAVAAVVALILGIMNASTERQLTQERAQSRQIAAVLAAPDARIVARHTASGGIATVVVSAQRRAVIITTAGLPTLPGGEVYELWLMGPPGTRRAGLLPAASSGRAGPVLATGLTRGDQLGMTVEPAGGTARPTTTPIVVIPLPG